MANSGVILDAALTTVQKVALGKVAAKADGQLTVGDHDFDFTVRVSGTARKGEDFTKTPTTSVPFKKVLALMVQYSGITRDAALATVEKAMIAALTDGVEPDLDVVESCEKKVKTMLGNLPKMTCPGVVTLVGDLQVALTADNMAERAKAA